MMGSGSSEQGNSMADGVGNRRGCCSAAGKRGKDPHRTQVWPQERLRHMTVQISTEPT